MYCLHLPCSLTSTQSPFLSASLIPSYPPGLSSHTPTSRKSSLTSSGWPPGALSGVRSSCGFEASRSGGKAAGRTWTDQHPPLPCSPGLGVLEPQALTWRAPKGLCCPSTSWLQGDSAHPPLASAPVLLACKTLCQTPRPQETAL